MNNGTNEMTYVETHPWLTFHIDLSKLQTKTWIQLGECAAKCDQISGVPLKPHVRDYLHLIYLTKGVRATTAIEGNTLSEEEVKKIIENKSDIPPSKEYLQQEIKNILSACSLIADHVKANVDIAITPEKICEYNGIVLQNLPLAEGVEPGKFRQHRVTVGKYLGPNPKEVPYLVNKLCNWLGEEFRPSQGINQYVFAILKAIVAHLYIAWIHPFGDGNGRTARLMEFKILAQSGIPLPATHILSNHYNNTRSEYYVQLDKTSRGGDINGFISYAVQGLLDGLKEQLAIIRVQQMEVAMENYIHETFRDKSGEIWKRRRNLALDLLGANKLVGVEDIPLLSSRLNAGYRNRNARTIIRDIGILAEMGIIKTVDRKIMINLKPIIAFLPLRRSSQ